MAIHNATKLLLLRSQTKLALTVTLTVTALFFMRTSLIPMKRFDHIYERNFSRRCVAGFVGGAIFCTTQQLHYPFADIAVASFCQLVFPVSWFKSCVTVPGFLS